MADELKPEEILSARIKAALDAPIDNKSDSNEVKQRFSDNVAKAILEVCEALANKVTAISSESTHIQYPTARAVYEALVTIATLHFEVVKQLPTEKISTDTIYCVPSLHPGLNNRYDEYYYLNEKWELLGSTYQDLSGYEKIANKVTEISLLSTDEEYPSAKLLYDQLKLKADVSKTYTKEEVDRLIESVPGVKFEIVAELPEEGEADTIYLLPIEDAPEGNIYEEYIYINDAWELIGTSKVIDDDVVSTETTWSSQKLNAPYNWVMQKMRDELYDLALEKLSVGTVATDDTYITDVVTSTTMVVTVTVKFDNVKVDADETPSGWTRTGTGTYTKSVTGASGSQGSRTNPFVVSGR